MKRREFLLLVGGLLVVRPLRGQELVDLNNATQEQIEGLPGIGEKMAEEIMSHRPFSKLEDLLEIPRFGAKRLEQIRDLVTIGEPGAQKPAATKAPAEETTPETWAPPSGMEVVQCWRCQEQFAVEAGTQAGVCAYCGVRWGRKGASR